MCYNPSDFYDEPLSIESQMASEGSSIVGLEMGMAFTKAFNGRDHVLLPSAITPEVAGSHPPVTRLGFPDETRILDINGRRYWLTGGIEPLEPSPDLTEDRSLFFSSVTGPLLLAAAAHLPDSNTPVTAITGLPASDISRYRSELAAGLTGRHRIQLFSGDRLVVRRLVHIQNAVVYPTPMGSLARLVLTPGGAPAQNEFAQAKIGIVDIGYASTDVIVVDRLQYLKRACGSFGIGIAKCLRAAAGRIKEKSGETVPVETLLMGFRMGSLTVRGQEYSLATLRDRLFRQTADDLAETIAHLWHDDWDIDVIVITGGGGCLLATPLSVRLPGDIRLLENPIDPRMNNAMGFYLVGLNQTGHLGNRLPF
jgi:plasmid segregation protein ParM